LLWGEEIWKEEARRKDTSTMSLPQRIPGLEAVTEPPQSLLMASQEVEKVLVMIWPEKRSCLPEKA
jgi:hypothetical protein